MFINQSGSFFLQIIFHLTDAKTGHSQVTSASPHLWPLKVSCYFFWLLPWKWSTPLCPIRTAKVPFTSFTVIHTYFVLFLSGCSVASIASWEWQVPAAPKTTGFWKQSKRPFWKTCMSLGW